MEQRKLYVDGLNFSHKFGFTTKAFNLRKTGAKGKIREFVESLRRAGWSLTVFIDAGIESDEALDKWKSRREQEIEFCKREVPPCLSNLIGEMFKAEGVTVWYSPVNADNDDCLASYAQNDEADVLSNDIDMARYVGRKYKQFGDFKIENGQIILFEKKIDESRLPSPREFLNPLPQMVSRDPGFAVVKEIKLYRRGSPFPFTRFTGNPHNNQKLRMMRSQLYEKLGLDVVTEEIPEWKDGKVEWTKTEVMKNYGLEEGVVFHNYPDINANPTELCKVVMKEAFKAKSSVEWPNRRPESWEDDYNFNMTIILMVSEVISAYHESDFLKLYRKLETDLFFMHHGYAGGLPEQYECYPTVCKNWKKDGNCRFGERCVAKTGHFNCTCWRGKQICRFRHE